MTVGWVTSPAAIGIVVAAATSAIKHGTRVRVRVRGALPRTARECSLPELEGWRAWHDVFLRVASTEGRVWSGLAGGSPKT